MVFEAPQTEWRKSFDFPTTISGFSHVNDLTTPDNREMA